jgi:hypothetical protein
MTVVNVGAGGGRNGEESAPDNSETRAQARTPSPASLPLYSVTPAKAGVQGRAASTLPVALDSSPDLIRGSRAGITKPADWLWRYPTDNGKGGLVFMHNGDNMTRYPDHGPHKQCLVRDICRGLMDNAGTMINRF